MAQPAIDPDAGHTLLDHMNPVALAAPESGIVEVVNYGRERPGIIPLWVGEGDTPTASFICDAAYAALKDGHTFYTYQRGIPPLRQAIADYHARSFGTPVADDQIFVTPSGMKAVELSLKLTLAPGDDITMVTPIWPNISAAAGLAGASVTAVPLHLRDGRWQLDLQSLFDACGPRTRALFVNSPHNPTGWTLSPEDMARIADFVRARGIWLIADEVYGRIVYDRPPRSFLDYLQPDEGLIVIGSFSKNWAMTGWRIGWFVAPAGLGQVIENLIQYSTSGVATFIQHAALKAVSQGDGVIDAQVEQCRIGRDIVCQRLGALRRVRLAQPDGAFYLFFGVDGLGDSRHAALELVDRSLVGLAPGAAFGPGGEGYFRLCFATSPERLTEAMDRLVPVLS